MRLSSRERVIIAEEAVSEHKELVGGPQVMIEPYNGLVSDAVAIVNKYDPQIIKDVSDIKINLSKNVIGEYQSEKDESGKNKSSTIWINMGKLEGDVRAKLSGQSEEVIRQEIVNQVASTIIHERTHMAGASSEAEPEHQEDIFMKSIQPQV